MTTMLLETKQARMWEHSVGFRQEVPLLVALDGGKIVERAGLLHWLYEAVESRWVNPVRVLAIEEPDDRNSCYAASAEYAEMVVGLLKQTLQEIPTSRILGLGASLGAVELLYIQRHYPQVFDALFLQSGTFYQHPSIPGERITQLIEHVRDTKGRPIPVWMTCGLKNDNLPSNEALKELLRAQGYPVLPYGYPEGHDWHYWRDAWTPGGFADFIGRIY